jgi:hypothetical protein
MNKILTFKAVPIPSGINVKGWNTIPIVEYEEPLASLANFSKAPFYVLSDDYWKRIPVSVKECYLREGLAHLLSKAAAELPNETR